MTNQEPTMQEVLTAIKDVATSVNDLATSVNEFATNTEERFTAIDNRFINIEGRFDGMDGRFEGLEGQVQHIKNQMVTKGYLDDKLFDLRGDLIFLAKQQNKKLNLLVEELVQEGSLSPATARRILATEPFPA